MADRVDRVWSHPQPSTTTSINTAQLLNPDRKALLCCHLADEKFHLAAHFPLKVLNWKPPFTPRPLLTEQDSLRPSWNAILNRSRWDTVRPRHGQMCNKAETFNPQSSEQKLLSVIECFKCLLKESKAAGSGSLS